MTDTEITELTQAVERLLASYGIYLTTDRFNSLCDHMAELVANIMENGE